MLPEFELFLDENHHNNKAILYALEESSVVVHRHRDHFKPQTPDTEWMRFVGERGWAVLTTDKRIRFRPLERHAVTEHHVAMFCFTSNNRTGAQMAQTLTTALPQMRTMFVTQPRPLLRRSPIQEPCGCDPCTRPSRRAAA